MLYVNIRYCLHFEAIVRVTFRLLDPSTAYNTDSGLSIIPIYYRPGTHFYRVISFHYGIPQPVSILTN
jgi:hypothetical protein